jgi:hypothetical protein
MTTLDWVLVLLVLGLAAVHIFYAIRYRPFFVVDKSTLHRSYWSMILEFKRHHPKAGAFLAFVFWFQIPLVLVMGLLQLFR